MGQTIAKIVGLGIAVIIIYDLVNGKHTSQIVGAGANGAVNLTKALEGR